MTTASPAPRGDPLVLIVDDDERNLRLARDVLRADGLRTIEAALAALPQAGEWFHEAGFAGYLEKPFDIREFAERVRGFCAPADV